MSNADNVRQFSLDLAKWVNELLPEEVVRVHTDATLELFRRLTRKSPVGNPSIWKGKAPKGYVGGTFRGFWQVYAGADPGTGTLLTRDLARRPRSLSDAETDARSSLVGLRPYSITYIMNGLPYAKRLNEGWSKQAPAGWVELAVAEVDQLVYASVADRLDRGGEQ